MPASATDTGIRVLVVETNRRNRELLCQFLAKAGIDNKTVASMEDLETVSLEGHDCILIDLGGLDRRIWSICSHLRRRDIPFVLILPWGHENTRRLFPEADAVLTKPVSPRKLVALIHGLTGK